MMLERLKPDGIDARARTGRLRSATTRGVVLIVVIGAGIRLGQAGIPYTVIEKNE